MSTRWQRPYDDAGWLATPLPARRDRVEETSLRAGRCTRKRQLRWVGRTRRAWDLTTSSPSAAVVVVPRPRAMRTTTRWVVGFRGGVADEECRRPSAPLPAPRVRVRRHERFRGLPACLGPAVPGQRLAGCLGGGCQSELGQAQAEGESERSATILPWVSDGRERSRQRLIEVANSYWRVSPRGLQVFIIVTEWESKDVWNKGWNLHRDCVAMYLPSVY